MTAAPKRSVLPHVVAIVFFALVAIAMVVLYFLFVQMSAGLVEENLKVCLSQSLLTSLPPPSLHRLVVRMTSMPLGSLTPNQAV